MDKTDKSLYILFSYNCEMGRKRIIFLVLAVVLSSIIAWNVINKDFSAADKDVIYSSSHLILELIISVGVSFLMVEGWLHIKKDKDKSIRHNLNRYIRILLAWGILVVHIVALTYGGY